MRIVNLTILQHPGRLLRVVVAVVALTATMAFAPTQASSQQQPEGSDNLGARRAISWTPERIDLSLPRGRYIELPVLVTFNEALIEQVEVEISKEIEGITYSKERLSVNAKQDDQIKLNLGIEIPVEHEFTRSHASSHCDTEGRIRLRVINPTGKDSRPLGEPLVICIVVSDDANTAIEDGFETPSSDRIVNLADGDEYVKGELVVGLDLELADPDSRMAELASVYGGTVVGSVTSIATYQVRFGLADYTELGAIRAQLQGEPGVEFASRVEVTQADTALPNDPFWDDNWIDWDGTGCNDLGNCDNATGGNNWYLEAMRMPAAWNRSTGDPSVRLGIIDSGFFDGHHEDIVDSVISVEGRQRGDRAHGERMASSACATGNNNIGISGMVWACSLYLYGNRLNSFAFLPDRSSSAAALEQMIEAVDDGVRIVNMSSAYVDNNQCVDSFDERRVLDRAEEQNDILARGVQYARRHDRDVLWIMSAGNSCRDVRFGAPSGLASRFPLDVMVVAAVNQNREPQRVTNFGEGVTVAAPGEDITQADTIDGNFDYTGGHDGTSSATALVSGLAALVLSHNPDFSGPKIKQCIVSAAQTSGVEVVGTGDTNVPAGPLGFNVVHGPSSVTCRNVVELPPEVDLVFAMDTSGSMGAELDRLKQEIPDIVSGLEAASPGTDFRYGLVSFEDYPGEFDSSVCPPVPAVLRSGYPLTLYGGLRDSPFRISQNLTSSSVALTNSVNALALGFGGDAPESYARVLWELGQDDTRTAMGFRNDALSLTIMMGDSVPHDANLNESGVRGEDVDPPFFSDAESDTGHDPGRNQRIDCAFTAGEDPDIDFHSGSISALQNEGIRLLYLDSSGGKNFEFWAFWASENLGTAAKLDPDGSIPGDLDLTSIILGLLQDA